MLKESSSWKKKVREFWDVSYKTPNRGFDPFSGIRRGDRAPRAKHFSPRGELAFPRATRGFIFSRIEAVRRYTVADLANVEPKMRKFDKRQKTILITEKLFNIYLCYEYFMIYAGFNREKYLYHCCIILINFYFY